MRITRRPRTAALAAALTAIITTTLTAILALGLTGTAVAAGDPDCADLTRQEDAQAVLDQEPTDPYRLDGGQDGPACGSLPARAVAVPTTPPPPPAATPQTTPPAVPADLAPAAPTAAPPAPAPDPDRDCPDFATQTAAQAALTSRTGDPERLDADGDGIACEQHFGTEGRQVAVFPAGGVATGGAPRR